LCYSVHYTYLGKLVATPCNNVLVGLEEVVNVSPQHQRQFGMAGPFPLLFREAWKKDEHVFAAEGGNATSSDCNTQRLGPPERVAADILNQHPVEVLAIKEPPKTAPRSHLCFWVKWLTKCKAANFPNYVIISAFAKEIVEDNGLQAKAW
jgi:hypothetical protein